MRVRTRICCCLAGVLVICALMSCRHPDDSDAVARRNSQQRQPVVYVVNYPLQFFAERIGGDPAATRQA